MHQLEQYTASHTNFGDKDHYSFTSRMREKFLNPHIIEENIAILLLGVVDSPVPSLFHLEQEIFILAQTFTGLGKEIKFGRSEKGPYSQAIRVSVAPFPHSNIFKIDSKGEISLTYSGNTAYEKITKELRKNPDFNVIIGTFTMARTIYDKLTEDELFFLLHDLYGDYTNEQSEYNRVNKDRQKLSDGLLNKKLITKSRYKELVGHVGE